MRVLRLESTKKTVAANTSNPPTIHSPTARVPPLATPTITDRRKGAQQTAHAASAVQAIFVNILMDKLVKV
jgi:hypothetical protein